MVKTLDEEFDNLEYLVSNVANAIEALERGDNIIDDDETPRQVQEMVNKFLTRKDLSQNQRKILQEIEFVGYKLEEISNEYQTKIESFRDTLED